MEKKVLIVIPNLEIGGTTSSLETFYRMLNNDYDISIAALYHMGDKSKIFCNRLLPEDLITASYCTSFRKAQGIKQLLAFSFKIIKLLCGFLKINTLEEIIFKRFIKKIERTATYDVVIAFEEGNSSKAVSFSTIRKRIAWVHCDYSRVPKCGTELSTYIKFDTIICVSKYTADIFKNIYPEIKNKVTYIYNPLDIELIKSKSEEPIDDKKFINDTFTIVSVGRISTVKRFEEIPKIAAFLKHKGCKFRWYILGPIIENNSYQSLKDAITKYNVNDYVIYLGNKNNPYPYMRNSNLLVSTSKSEACPMIFNEAKILALPIISTDFGSSYEFINIGHNGMITKIEKMGETVYKLYMDTELYKSIKGNLTNEVISNSKIYSSIVNII